MKYVPKAIAAIALLLSTSVALAAGVAGIDMARVVENIPQKKAIEDNLKKEFGGRIAELQKLEKEIQGLLEKGQRDGQMMSEQQRVDLKRKIEDLDASYKLKGKALSEDTQRRQMEERNRLVQLVRKASMQVATRDGYDAVIDLNVAAYIEPKRDITDKVIMEIAKMK